METDTAASKNQWMLCTTEAIIIHLDTTHEPFLSTNGYELSSINCEDLLH